MGRRIRVHVSAGVYPLAFVCGALLGTAWDRMHVAAGALSYSGTSHPQPWWVPVEFGIAGLVIVAGVRNAGDPIPLEGSPRRALGETLWFSALYAVTAFLWKRPEALTVILAVALLVRAPALQQTGRGNVVPALALVVGGPSLEATLSAMGLFRYARADLWGIPIWLPLLYMNAVPFIVRGTEAVLWIPRKRPAVTAAEP